MPFLALIQDNVPQIRKLLLGDFVTLLQENGLINSPLVIRILFALDFCTNYSILTGLRII